LKLRSWSWEKKSWLHHWEPKSRYPVSALPFRGLLFTWSHSISEIS